MLFYLVLSPGDVALAGPLTASDQEEASNRLAAAAAAKRKSSFKNWLRSSHRKFTANRAGPTIKEADANASEAAPPTESSKFAGLSTNADLDNMKIKVSSGYFDS